MAPMHSVTTERHLLHSHAREEEIPGTVNVKAAEGDDTAYGQALFPVPAEDPNDPLQWSGSKKTMILLVCCFYSFLGSAALQGPGPHITLWSEIFNVSQAKASELISYPNLAYGFGSLVLVPMYMKFGRRPVMLGSMVIFIAGLTGAAQANTYDALMVARVILCFGSGVCEALPVQLVNDIFFLHERGKYLGFYTCALCFGPISTLPAAYMLSTGPSWRTFNYAVLGFAVALFFFAFLCVEETSYDRKAHMDNSVSATGSHGSSDKENGESTTIEHTPVIPARKSFLSTLRPWSGIDHTVSVFTMMWRSFTYFLIPQVFWVITTFGINIGLGALTFNFVFPIKITASPYNWPVSSSGLGSLGSFIGYIFALPFTDISDRLAARLTLRNDGIREAEMRLGAMLPGMIIGPVGLIVYGLTAELNLHWIGYYFGTGLTCWGGYFFFCFTLAYSVDSYYADTSEMLIAMNIGKQIVSFGLGVGVLDWVMRRGYAVVISGIFCAVLLANNLLLLVFMIWGKRIRRYVATSWLARLHGKGRAN
ncbi:hypothetical protein DL771_003241 [Monosporascus sp. 5C6A]|nr:hypothetical protein DL771_003241 [Monosporascus sp. 5C6A]